jgi:hypothetical protein
MTIKEGMKDVCINFTVPPPTTGTIRLPDGSPAANLPIEYSSIREQNGSNVGRSTTDENGVFSIILSEYGNMIRIKTADGKYGIVKYLEGKERLTPQTWTLHEACVGKVRIVDGRTGKPIAGHKLHSNVLLRFGNNGSYGAGPLTAVSDEEGNVELKPLFPEGEYRMSFLHPPGVREYPSLAVTFFPQMSGETIDLGTVEVEDFERRAKEMTEQTRREPATVSPVASDSGDTVPGSLDQLVGLSGRYVGREKDGGVIGLVLTAVPQGFEANIYEGGLPETRDKIEKHVRGTAAILEDGKIDMRFEKMWETKGARENGDREKQVPQALRQITATWHSDENGKPIIEIPKNKEWDHGAIILRPAG